MNKVNSRTHFLCPVIVVFTLFSFSYLHPFSLYAFESNPLALRDQAGEHAVIPEQEPNSGDSREQIGTLKVKMGKVLIDDARYIFSSPSRVGGKELAPLGIAAVSLGGLMLADDSIYDYSRRNRSETKDDVADSLEKAGSAGTVFLVNLGLIGAGLWSKEKGSENRLLETSLVATEAQLFTEGIGGLVKFAVGRHRPGDGQGSSSYDPFHKFDRSFPSGHAARSFAVAAVFAERYDYPVPLIAYSAASLISLSRIYQNDHFASDVLAGAGLGFLIGKALIRRHNERGSRFTLLPCSTPRKSGFGLALQYRF